MSTDYPLTLPLSKTYTLGDATFSSLLYREPRYPDYVAEGLPQQWVYGDGNRVLQTSTEIIHAYVDRLFERSDQAQIVNLADTLKIEDTILDFFSEARISNATQADSSGDSDGDRQTSET